MRVTVINNTYNVGCSGFKERYASSNKPIRVCHFHPTNRIAWDTFARDRNRLGEIVLPDSLVRLFLNYFGDKIQKFKYKGERGYDGDWRKPKLDSN